MSEAELKAKLERAIGGVSTAEWQNLRRRDIVGEYFRNPLQYPEDENWREFREDAKRELAFSRSFREDHFREQVGDLQSDLAGAEVDAAPIPGAPVTLSERTSARSGALSAFNRLHAGEIPASRARVSSTIFPRGGVDGTFPQWVIVMAVEAWLPAEEVKEVYSQIQRSMLAEKSPPKTTERSFHVAKFVWEQELIYGARPPWQVLKERWNALPWAHSFGWAKPFNTWQAFRMSFERGKKATPPQYTASEEQLTDLVRSRGHAGVLDAWAAKLRE
jgi:hypothetical protein